MYVFICSYSKIICFYILIFILKTVYLRINISLRRFFFNKIKKKSIHMIRKSQLVVVQKQLPFMSIFLLYTDPCRLLLGMEIGHNGPYTQLCALCPYTQLPVLVLSFTCCKIFLVNSSIQLTLMF